MVGYVKENSKFHAQVKESAEGEEGKTIFGVGTASYDPRPAVAKFLSTKDRRDRSADPSVYAEREFVKKFFRSVGEV